uniref:C2H2-type domain-containing protein n=1 Tax=Chromera velia CCMP2878 TaxID=1169474 RepID=A0A0G4I1E4_9ALVE|mmetsp:Transcript_33014/g.65417  ORF Transcript_33014/g.65417 Transcript_33014/m.65417 type:complete len:180 (-) Transcript_33014:165-704(-)|eukprot:Cvel_10110.t1-p1 / transcript=Cvel_10110.t1 / gene=Cvel_10110 / organism=Chromera_velia_CCMP2878 / gene_product=UPF0428 protein CXorf56 homolog, putative / transcript_product=UPF0428 protein CXorf56 homolog, putative / location=Cvel_scaffold602:51902-53277(+) / protein_length=179 / sequence_SO=supercontig / SO=protein_coding / is_pseudo=false
MPKVVSFRARVFTNADRDLSSDDKFHTLSCAKCRALLIITDADVAEDKVPKRKTDGASVLDASKSVVKVCCEVADEPKEIRRQKGIEDQWEYRCPDCKTKIAYQCTDPQKTELKYLYVHTSTVLWPYIRKKTNWVCKTCGYVCRDQSHLDQHLKQRGHEAAKPGEASAREGPVAPVIVG